MSLTGKGKHQGRQCPPAECWSAGCVAALHFLTGSTPCATEKRGSWRDGITSRSPTDACWLRTWFQTPCMNLQSAFPRVNETAGGVHLSSREHRSLVCIQNGFGLATWELRLKGDLKTLQGAIVIMARRGIFQSSITPKSCEKLPWVHALAFTGYFPEHVFLTCGAH